MANDKTFKVKNALEVGGTIKTSLGTITSSNIDLSTGNYFKDTTNTTTYTISNPSPVQSFNLELTGATADVANNFSTTLYSGANAAKTITNNIDLAGDGGLVWTKWRSGALGSAPHVFTDTERGVNKNLKSNTTDAQESTNSITSFTSTGYTIDAGDGPQGGTNYNGGNYVSWTFKKAAGFFDVVTYTGNGSARTISHNLGSVPGMIIIKRYDAVSSWAVYHRGVNGGTTPEQYSLELNATGAGSDDAFMQDTAPTSTHFSLNTFDSINNNGTNYVAYLFGHDTSSSSNIKCGYYTGNGSASGPSINLGWSPQWLLIRNSERTAQWRIIDTARDFSSTATRDGLWANSNANEDTTSPLIIARTSTGFDIKDNNSGFNHSGEKIIYVAIRLTEPKFTLDLSTGNRFSFTPTAATELVFSNPPATGIPTGFSLEVVNPSAYALTWPSSIKWHGGSAPTVNAGKAVYAFITTDGGTNYFGKLAGEGIA